MIIPLVLISKVYNMFETYIFVYT